MAMKRSKALGMKAGEWWRMKSGLNEGRRNEERKV